MAQKYIVGDIVMYENRIHTIIDTLRLNNYELSYVRHPVNQAELSGFPLTHEILEKNGWKLSHGFYWSPNEEGAGVGLSSQTGYVWEAYIGRHLLRSNINNVSDLQHLLFGLGLNSEMEV
jgi:hypothetical protein